LHEIEEKFNSNCLQSIKVFENELDNKEDNNSEALWGNQIDYEANKIHETFDNLYKDCSENIFSNKN